MGDNDIIQLTIQIDGSSMSERRLNDTAVKLKHELSHLKPLTVDLQRDRNVPDGAMSVEAFTLGALALSVLPTMVPATIEFLRDWCLRNANRTITIKRRSGENEIELSFPEDVSPERLQKFIAAVALDIAKPSEHDQQ
jgi:hypothetical protein